MKHNLRKRLLSLGLLITLLLTPVLSASAQEPEKPGRELHIFTEDQFLTLAENCRIDSYSRDLTVYLDKDISLKGLDFQGIPIFLGTLEGNHHSITDLHITAGGSQLGFIRQLTETGAVRNLNLQGSLTPEGSQTHIGGLAGENYGTIENCSFEGSLTGKDCIGGMVGLNGLTGLVERCTVKGTIRAEHKIGGIAGENLGVIRDCGNLSMINITPQDNTVKVAAITMDTLTGTEDPHTVTDVGGIAGISSGVIRSCTNRGNVGYIHMGYNIGGIAGCHSGLIADCQNYGEIRARKEAGGIVGQFLPAAKIEYQKDTLQILEEQLNGTNAALNQAAYNTQHNLGVVGEGIGALQEDAELALDALEQLRGSGGTVPDPDQLLAAKNALEQSISSLDTHMTYLQQAASGTAGQISKDLQRVSGQVSAMSQTLRNAENTTGASLEDVSDQDTPEDLTGKVVSCLNYGPVSGDINAGGICGAVSFEAEQDPEDELILEGKQSLNAKGQLRAVILDCENRGEVSAKKIYAGGIVGRLTLGLVKNSCNTGTVTGEKAQYVGGIAGSSLGYLRSSHAKCLLIGGSYVGGIAGSASMAEGCRSMVYMNEATERQGGILGFREENSQQELPDPIAENFYMSLREDPGAIDGVSYQGQAEPLTPSRFLNQQELPETFRSASLIFRYEDGSQRELTVPVGTQLRDSQIPTLPQKEGYEGAWKGFERIRGRKIYFDAVFTPVYEPNRITVRSGETRKNGRPILLAEGHFPQMEQIPMEKLKRPELEDLEALEAWSIPQFTQEGETVLHFSLPGDAEPDHLKILLKGGDGTWRETQYTLDLSYAVFSCSAEDTAICAAATRDYSFFWFLGWGLAGLLGLAGIWLIKKQLGRRKKAHPRQEPDANTENQ